MSMNKGLVLFTATTVHLYALGCLNQHLLYYWTIYVRCHDFPTLVALLKEFYHTLCMQVFSYSICSEYTWDSLAISVLSQVISAKTFD